MRMAWRAPGLHGDDARASLARGFARSCDHHLLGYRIFQLQAPGHFQFDFVQFVLQYSTSKTKTRHLP